MAVAEEKTRVMVTFPKELLKRVDEYCAQTGMNRSSYIGYTVATSLDTYKRLVAAAENGVTTTVQQAQE